MEKQNSVTSSIINQEQHTDHNNIVNQQREKRSFQRQLDFQQNRNIHTRKKEIEKKR